MKKITAFTLLVAIATVLFSCSKKEDSVIPNPNVQPPTASVVAKGINYLSKWVTLPMEITADRHSSWLQGSYELADTADYDYTTHKQFVFIRMMGRDSYVYRSLPLHITAPDGGLEFGYKAKPTGFDVTIKRIDIPVKSPNPLSFVVRTSNYRFLIVTDSTSRAHNIDWTDYDQVAGALSGSIWFD
jgi:hypothetical protein